jgi:hypothetical protein
MQKDDLVRLRHMLDAAKDLPPLVEALEKIIPRAE